MDFQQVEQQFRQLEAAYVAGQIDLAAYRKALANMRIVDSSGVTWQIQERSGTWYCYWQGQWVPRSPYPAPPPQPPVQPAQAPYQPAQPSYPSSAQPYPAAPTPYLPVQQPYPPAQTPAGYAPQSPARHSRLPLFIGIGAAALVVIVGLVLLLGDGLNPQNSSSMPTSQGGAANQPTLPAVLNLQKVSEASLTANGSPVTDANGVTVQIPAEVLKSDTPKAVVTTHKMQGALADALAQSFTIDSPVYTLAAAGQQDSTGRATIVFPASSPQSRLVEIIDDRYAFLVNTQPVNGKLTYYSRLGPADTQGLEPVGSYRFDGSRRMVVVTPKKAGQSEILPVSAHSQAGIGLDCSVTSNYQEYPCRANEAGTVKVSYTKSMALTVQQAYQIAKEAEKWMNKYAQLGFTNADLSRYWFALYIVIVPGSGDPYYSPKSGSVYIPLDYAKKITAGEGSIGLLHELAHWIQDEAYRMAWAGLKSYISSGDFWWLDVAAENMVMLAEPSYIAGNLARYGAITDKQEALVWQLSPRQWPADLYAQAQLVKVFMCESSACLTSEKSFKEAINKGSYPFAASDADQKLMANLEDYARYLIGAAPKKTNTAIPLNGVADGTKFGESITVSQKSDSLLNFSGNRKPQVVKAVADKVKNGLPSLEFTAPLERYGVYPLTISSQKGYAGLPTMLVVEGGVPLVYRLDNGEVKVHSGDKPLILGPISAEMGYSQVRLAAYSTVTGQVFKARLEVIDLKGAWVFETGAFETPKSNAVTCDTPVKDLEHEEFDSLPVYSTIAIALGEFAPSSDATKQQWTLQPKRLPSDVKQGSFSANYQLEMTPKEITIKGNFDMPKKKAELPGAGQAAGWMVTFVGAGLTGAAGLKRCSPRSRRWLAMAGMLAVLAILLTGCGDFYGSTSVEIKITKLGFGGGDTDATVIVDLNEGGNPAEKPIWTILQATGNYTINSTQEGLSSVDKNAQTTYHRCTGPMSYALSGGVYPDIRFKE